MTTKDEHLHKPILKDYDKASIEPFLKPSNGPYQDPESLLSTKQHTSNTPSRAQAIRTLLLLFCCFTLSYITTFHTIIFLDTNSGNVFQALKDLLSNTYHTLSTQYTLLMDPPTQQEIVDLMTEFYTLLSEMGYYPPSLIAQPPHQPPNKTINHTLALEIGYSPAAIQMMQLLPYLNQDSTNDLKFAWDHGAYPGRFMLDGGFADLRNDEMLGHRDPFFQWQYDVNEDGERTVKDWDEDGGLYMYPDYILLSQIVQDGCVIVLNVKNLKLWTITSYDQEMRNADPATLDIPNTEVSPNWVSIENFPSRLTRDALRDYISNFRTLKWLPGGLETGSYEGDCFVDMYERNGWFDKEKWNRTKFLEEVKEWQKSERIRWMNEEPYEMLDIWQKGLDRLMEGIRRKELEIEGFDRGERKASEMGEEERVAYRRELVEGLEREKGYIPWSEMKVEDAKKKLEGSDPTVKEARERRIEMYGS